MDLRRVVADFHLELEEAIEAAEARAAADCFRARLDLSTGAAGDGADRLRLLLCDMLSVSSMMDFTSSSNSDNTSAARDFPSNEDSVGFLIVFSENGRVRL